MDLLTTYTHHSDLQIITALSLISTIHRLPQHLLSLFHTAVITSHYLATTSKSGDSSASRIQILSSQPPSQNASKLNTDYSKISSQPPLRAQLNCQPSTELSHSPTTSLHSTELHSAGLGSSLYSLSQTQQKTPFFYCCTRVRLAGTRLLSPLEAGCITVFYYCFFC
jgi:hypothetical protein